MPSIVVSLRIQKEELAKALEGLTEKDLNSSDLTTISNIVKSTFYYGIISLCKNPSAPAEREFRKTINQILNQNKKNKSIKIKDLLKN